VAGVAVLAVERAVVRADDHVAGPSSSADHGEEPRQHRIDISQRRGVAGQVVLGGAGPVVAVRLVQGGDVDEGEQRSPRRETGDDAAQPVDLGVEAARGGDAERRLPVRLGEQTGQDPAERCSGVEEAHTAEADRVVAPGGQRGRQVGRVEDVGVRAAGLAAGETGREEALVRARGDRGRQEAREEGVVRGVGEAGRGVPALPGATGQDPGQVRGAAVGQRGLGHVEAQRVEGDEQQVVAVDQLAHNASDRPADQVS
jgi:hypothetical protein